MDILDILKTELLAEKENQSLKEKLKLTSPKPEIKYRKPTKDKQPKRRLFINLDESNFSRKWKNTPKNPQK